MTETTDPQQAARDRLFALIASIPGSGGVDWCGKARALLNEIAAVPAAAPSAPADQTALRDRIAAALIARIKQAVIPKQPQPWGGPVGSLLAATEFDLADAVLAVLPETTDRTAELSPTERTMLTYALNQAQLRMWATGKFTDEDQAAVVSLRRMADEAQHALPSIHANDVQGFCPACGHPTLYVGEGGHLTCSLMDCPKPGAADELLCRVADEAQQPETQAAPDPSWPRRAWNLGLLHKGGDPHHCPACVAQPEPPKDFICPGAEANAEVLANPQPAAGAQQPKEA